MKNTKTSRKTVPLKKTVAKKTTSKADLKPLGSVYEKRYNVMTTAHDHISRAYAHLVPERYRGTDKYLDVVQWNIEKFGAQLMTGSADKRYPVLMDVLEALNADLFIFEEVAGPSADGRYEGGLDAVAKELNRRGAGNYVVHYTKAGGAQRIAMMWDLDFVRHKSEVEELFPKHTHKKPGNPDPFAERTPLYGNFTTRADNASVKRFDFQTIGVHLKSAWNGGLWQRTKSAEILSGIIQELAADVDTDVMLMGDFNAPPSDDCWKAFHQLEKKGLAAFRSINDEDDFSYLWLKKKDGQNVSRIDLSLLTTSSAAQMVDKTSDAIQWQPIEETIALAGHHTATAARKVMKEMKELISDHLPVVTRFYFDVKQ